MLSTLVTLLVCAKSVLYYTFVASLYIGKTLFEQITTSAIKLSGLCSSILAAVEILLEDFAIFIHDLSNHAGFGLALVYKTFEYLLGALIFIYNPISSSLQWIFNAITVLLMWISKLYYNVSAVISFILMNAKKLLVLFGSGVWFAITLVPIAIISGSMLLVNYVGVLLEEVNILKNAMWINVLSGIKTATEFFWDVPLEAFLGLASLACMLYLFATYLSYIRASVTRYSRNVQVKMRIKLPVKVIREPVMSPEKTGLNEDLAICVVCQTKPKNMLILPCKHLCTCEDCMKQIVRQSGRCPLCRTRMDRTVLVYL